MNANAEKWVTALESGEFEQAQHVLRETDAFCCLGVACEIYRLETGRGEWKFLPVPNANYNGLTFLPNPLESQRSVLPPTVQAWLGLGNEKGTFEGGCLSEENDRGATFSEIAELIRNKAELFTATED